MVDDADDLNYDCNYNMFLAKTMLHNLLSHQEKRIATRWLHKLATSNRTLEEMKLRNDFMYHLVLNIQAGELQPPFCETPPPGPLHQLTQLLPGGIPGQGGKSGASGPSCWTATEDPNPHKPMLYRQSPDGGEFLAAQPIPRCGAFCYLAVVSKAPEKSDDECSNNFEDDSLN